MSLTNMPSSIKELQFSGITILDKLMNEYSSKSHENKNWTIEQPFS